MDDDLSDRARLLIDVAMQEDLPPPALADGSWEMVVSRLTLEAAREGEAPSIAVRPATRASNWVGIVVLALALVVAGGLLWLVLQPRPSGPPAPAPPATTAPAVVPDPSRALPTAAPAEPRFDAAKLLDDAEAAEPARALELLARHAELAPLGTGTERRMALRISALCALGRTEDARADARAFSSRPRDPKWAKHVRASCAGR